MIVSVAPPNTAPDNASAHVKVTVTSELAQPFALAAGVREAVAVGGVLSTEMPVIDSGNVLPARSSHENALD
jgi:hypothetical protein